MPFTLEVGPLIEKPGTRRRQAAPLRGASLGGGSTDTGLQFRGRAGQSLSWLPWSVLPGALERFEQALQHLPPIRGQRGSEAASRELPMTITNGIAVIDLVGLMIKGAGPFAGEYGVCDTALVRHAVQTAAADSKVSHILLRVDSPGGSVDGLADLGDAIFAARATKPTIAQIDGLCASAALYAAVQAQKVFAGRTDLVGSIGTIALYWDDSKYFERLGIEAVPIASSPLKAFGAPGVPITDDMRAEAERIVEWYFADFREMVGRGRGLSVGEVDAVATAQIWPAPDAGKLIDGVQAFDATLGELLNEKRQRYQQVRTRAQHHQLMSDARDARALARARIVKSRAGQLVERSEKFIADSLRTHEARLRESQAVERGRYAASSHEAGHGIAMAQSNLHIMRIKIWPEESGHWCGEATFRRESIDSATNLFITLSGPAAEELMTGKQPILRGVDKTEVQRALGINSSWSDDPKQICPRQYADAKDRLMQHRPALAALTDLIFENKSATSADVTLALRGRG